MPKPHYRPDTFKIGDSVGYLIKRTQRMMQERIESLFEPHGFTLQQWAVMMYVREGVALTVADVCRELHHDSGAMTRLIDQLEDRKLIERNRNAQDRRVVELSLTPLGNETLDALIVIATDALNSTLEGFTREEVKLLQSMLWRLIGRLETLLPRNSTSSSIRAPEHMT